MIAFMSTWEALGWLGQGCFFSRFFVQWLVSEKARRSASPRSFWWLSLVGTLLVGGVAAHQGEWLLVPAYVLGGLIYFRNLWLSSHDRSESPAQFRPILITALAAMGVGVLLWSATLPRAGMDEIAWPWIAAGVCGQLLWGTRFVIQWWASEKRGESHFPLAFWWMSLIGAGLNIAYTSQLETLLFLVGYLPAWFVPARNLILEYRSRREQAVAHD